LDAALQQQQLDLQVRRGRKIRLILFQPSQFLNFARFGALGGRTFHFDDSSKTEDGRRKKEVQKERYNPGAMTSPARPVTGTLAASLAVVALCAGMPILGFAAPKLAVSTRAKAGQQPLFRSSVELVTVDATALDPSGRPVVDLTADQFVLEIDGRSRPVVSAAFVSQPAASREAAIPRSFTSNEDVNEGRLILVAVDQQNIRRLEGARALKAASSFIESLNPEDRVAVTGLTELRPLEFRRDRARARRTLEQLVGEGDPVFIQYNIGLQEAMQAGDGNRTVLSDLVRRECGRSDRVRPFIDPARINTADEARDPCPEEIEQEARAIAQHTRATTVTSMAALSRLIASLAELDGPKALVLLSEGLVAEPQLVDFDEIAQAARKARVVLYVLQLDVPLAAAAEARPSPSQLPDRQLRADGLSRLAGAARGELFTLVGADPAPFARILTELSGYYLIAFEPRESDRDGRPHRLRVAVRRRGVTVRSRPSFRMDALAGSRASEDELVTVLRKGAVATELPVRVAAYVCREPRSRLVRAVISAEAPPAPGSSAVALAFVLRDRSDVVVASGTERSESGQYAFSAVVPPGEYLLKIAAIDGLGRRGSLERVLAMPNATALPESDLILAPEPQPATAPMHPIVDRAPDDRLLAYLELYPQPQEPRRRVTMEIASGVDAPALLSAAATLDTPGRGLVVARAVLSMKGLARGTYYARAVIDGRRTSGRWFSIGPTDRM
jgi:VWFA-related protein